MEEGLEKDETQVRLAFRVGYLGGRFHGSQVQAGERTVEGEFISACVRTGLFSGHREARFLAAGRTDRGVHSRGQVFVFTTSLPERALTVLKWQLPPDIWISGYAEVEPAFHPRHHALTRTYRYYFGECGLDNDAMDRAARLLCGSHDFSSFARVGDKDPVRRVHSARVFSEKGFLVFEIRAESYLWHMVRYLASALCRVGKREKSAEYIAEQLSGRAPPSHGMAPPGGLILWEVDYGFNFNPLPPDWRTERFLEAEWQQHRLLMRVCEALLEDASP